MSQSDDTVSTLSAMKTRSSRLRLHATVRLQKQVSDSLSHRVVQAAEDRIAGRPGSGVDSLASDPAEPVNVVLTNPPFGKKSSISIVNEDAELENDDSTYERTGFWVTTKNKPLNYLQHVKINGRGAVVFCRSLPRWTFERSSNPRANVHSTSSRGHFFNSVLVAGRDESRSPFRQKGPARQLSGTGGSAADMAAMSSSSTAGPSLSSASSGQ